MNAWAPLAALVALSVTLGAARAETVSFDGETVAQPPAGWTLAVTGRGAAKWTVEADASAPSKGNVLKQSGQGTYVLALRDKTALADGFVETRFKAISGSEDRAAGLIWRATNKDNYYVVRANALEDNVVAYKTVNGVRSSIPVVGGKSGGYGLAAPVPPAVWHTLRVEFVGPRFKVIYNGKLLFEVEDKTFSGAGAVGLWTKADSVTLFDDVSFGALP